MGLVLRTTVIVLTATALAAASARVEELAVREGTAPAVELTLSSPVVPDVHQLASPPRVYVDLRDAAIAPTVGRQLDGTGLVRRVRLGQFDATTVRLVVDLARPSRFELRHDGRTIALVLSPEPAAAPASSTPKSAKPAARDDVATRTTADAKTPPRAPCVAPAEPAETPRLAVARTEEPLPAPRKPESIVPAALQDTIARRYAAEDWPAIVGLYATNLEAIRRDADSATRAAVVDALRELGLVHAARKLLGPAAGNEAPALRVARAELALDAGESEESAAAVAGVEDAMIDPALVPRLARLRVRLALARGDLDGAANGIGNRAAPELRAELADKAIAAGRTATESHACERAIAAYRQALEADGGRTARAAAGAGLVRAAIACGNREATMSGLGVLAESTHPLLRRAASVIAATQADEPPHGGLPRRPAVGRGG